jgi:hypothetical protein
VIVGHIVVAAGILPGYRGAWRSMHLGGRVSLDTARRLWPGWTERRLAAGGVARSEPRSEATPARSRPAPAREDGTSS